MYADEGKVLTDLNAPHEPFTFKGKNTSLTLKPNSQQLDLRSSRTARVELLIKHITALYTISVAVLVPGSMLIC